MKLKKCPSCTIMVSTKTVKNIGRGQAGLFLNCNNCHSTLLLKDLKFIRKLD